MEKQVKENHFIFILKKHYEMLKCINNVLTCITLDYEINRSTSRYYKDVVFFPAESDITSPIVIGCPQNAISVKALEGSNFATATWTEPTATDDSGVAPALNRTHFSGQSFPVGTTVVVYRFTDGSGNSDTCEFKVVVSSKCYKTSSSYCNCKKFYQFYHESCVLYKRVTYC